MGIQAMGQAGDRVFFLKVAGTAICKLQLRAEVKLSRMLFCNLTYQGPALAVVYLKLQSIASTYY
jgi:hypothetical protein